MNILLLDEDQESMPHFVDVLELSKNKVDQVATRDDFLAATAEKKYDLLILDLMVPDANLAGIDTDAGYTAGVAIYSQLDPQKRETIPFMIYSAAPLNSSTISGKLSEYRKSPMCFGIFRKGVDDKAIRSKIAEIQGVPLDG